MTDLPPAYESLKDIYHTLPDGTKEEVKQLAFTDISPSLKSKIVEAVQQKASDPAFQNMLLKEVEKLGNTVIELDKSFEDVRFKLGLVDQGSNRKDGKPTTNFQATWEEYQKRWKKILSQSRDTASRTTAYIKTFLAILPQLERANSLAEMKNAQQVLEELTNQMNDAALNPNQTHDMAEQHSEAFSRLKNDMEGFSKGFHDFAKNQKVDVNEAISNKRKEIRDVQNEIDKSRALIAGLGIGVGLTVFGGAAIGVGIGVACTVLAPLAAGLLFLAVAAALITEGVFIAKEVRELEGKTDKKAKLDRELQELQSQLANLDNLQIILDKQELTIKDCGERLNQFPVIWNAVQNMSQEILTFIKFADHTSNLDFFKLELGLARTHQENLKAGLELYATKVA